MYDVVYLLKNDYDRAELKYSLRSLVNFPHAKVWFFGGQPPGLVPDGHDYHKQRGIARYIKSTFSLRRACLNDEVSDPFWLFNDDFFVMEPVEDVPVYHRGDLLKEAAHVRDMTSANSDYAQKMEHCARVLKGANKTTFAYNVHCPMLIHKQGALEAMDNYPQLQLFRIVYGNHMDLGGTETTDFKVHKITQHLPESAFVSTSDSAFSDGLAGIEIRQAFPIPSKYERTD